MAYDKIIPIRRRLDHCVDYALNEEKTSLSAALGYIGNEEKNTQPGGDVLETALNCELGTAYRDMTPITRLISSSSYCTRVRSPAAKSPMPS